MVMKSAIRGMLRTPQRTRTPASWTRGKFFTGDADRPPEELLRGGVQLSLDKEDQEADVRSSPIAWFAKRIRFPGRGPAEGRDPSRSTAVAPGA